MNKSYPFDRARHRKKNREFLFLLPAGAAGVYLAATEFATKPFDGTGVIFMTLTLLVLGAVCLIRHQLEKAAQRRRIDIDYDHGVVKFFNHAFITKFAGNKKLEIVEVPFTGLYKVSTWNAKGTLVVDVSTQHGSVSVSGLEIMDELIASLEEIANANKEQNPRFIRQSEAAPKPTTPWYGWLILATAVAAIAFVGYLNLYRD